MGNDGFRDRQARALRLAVANGVLTVGDMREIADGGGVFVEVDGIEAAIADAEMVVGQDTVHVAVAVEDDLGEFFLGRNGDGYVANGTAYPTFAEAWYGGLAEAVRNLLSGHDEDEGGGGAGW